MNGREFVRRARRYARRTGQEFIFEPDRGKGSHALLHIGRRRTIVPYKEISPALLATMLKDLDIDRRHF